MTGEQDVERVSEKWAADSRRNDRWVDLEVTTNILPRSEERGGEGFYAASEPGANRAHLRIRIPVVVGYAWFRIRDWWRG